MDIHKVRELLSVAVEKAGGQAEYARLYRISNGYVGDALVGRREPGKKILAALGLEKTVSYRRSAQ